MSESDKTFYVVELDDRYITIPRNWILDEQTCVLPHKKDDEIVIVDLVDMYPEVSENWIPTEIIRKHGPFCKSRKQTTNNHSVYL